MKLGVTWSGDVEMELGVELELDNIVKRLGLGLGTWDLGPGTWDLGPRT